MVRAFLAISPPTRVRDYLARRCRDLARDLPPGLRWVPPQNFHVTLAFLGDQAQQALEQLAHRGGPLFSKQVSLEVVLEGVAGFPRRSKPAAVVATVCPNPELQNLYACTQGLLAELGMSSAAGKYRPHLTLSRVRRGGERGIGDYLRAHPVTLAARWPVAEIALWASELRPEGAKYRELTTLKLGAGD